MQTVNVKKKLTYRVQKNIFGSDALKIIQGEQKWRNTNLVVIL